MTPRYGCRQIVSATVEAIVITYALLVAGACLLTAALGRLRPPLLVLALVGVELVASVQAVLDLSRLARDGRPADLSTHVAYLLITVAALPVAAGSVQMDRGRWGTVGLAIGCIVVAAVSVRLHQTAPSG